MSHPAGCTGVPDQSGVKVDLTRADVAELTPAKADRDWALVDALRRRESTAAERLLETFGDRVYRLAMRITGNEQDAEEVVQDAFLSVLRHIDTFRGESLLGSWIYRITANTATQKLRGRRSKRNEVSWEDLTPSFDDKGHHLEVAVDWSRRLTDPAIEGELRSVIGGAIDRLPADHRTAFLLRDVEGLSYPEIAETLQIKLGTVKSRVHRTRLFLRRGLAAYMDETFGVAQKAESHSRLASV